MAADLKAEGAKINSELDKFNKEVTACSMQTKRSTFFFTAIEDQCVDLAHAKCISQHDQYKLEVERLQRSRFKEFFQIEVNCSKLVHHLHQWENPVPVNSEEQLEKAKSFMTCFRPHAEKLLEIAREEVSLLKRATHELRRTAGLKGD